MTTYPLPTLACTISSTGITAPSYADVLASMQASVQSIYGSDIYITPDSQDGQLIGIVVKAISDTNQTVIAAYNQFSPATSQGTGLSSVVKINGLQREAASQSTANLTIVGVAGTIINGGIAVDNLGNQWLLPNTVTIPVGGEIIVTASCAVQGNITAAENAINVILTPTLGWQTVTNAAPATQGAPVETDATLRQRQSVSTSLPAQTVLDAIVANVANVAGVENVTPYQNSTATTDGNGLPRSSISLVVLGGSAFDITNAIAAKKSPGTGTYGTTSEVVIDQNGVPDTISYFVLAETIVYVSLSIQPTTGYVSTTGNLIIAALSYYVSNLATGAKVQYGKLWGPANLMGDAATISSGLTQAALDILANTYEVTALTVGTSSSPSGVIDIPIALNAAASCPVANVVLTTL